MTSFVRTATGGLMTAPYDVFAQMVEAENSKTLGSLARRSNAPCGDILARCRSTTWATRKELKEIREAESALPGLCLAGNYLTGRSIGDCAESGLRAAENFARPHAQLRRPISAAGARSCLSTLSFGFSDFCRSVRWPGRSTRNSSCAATVSFIRLRAGL